MARTLTHQTVHVQHHETQSFLRILTIEEERALRAQAWRYVRRINPVVARRMWVKVRKRNS